MEVLLARMAELVGDGPELRPVAADLRCRYAEPQRHHHTAEHLAEMADALDRLTGVGTQAPAAVTCAVLWHDAVYDPRAADNEERSAELARAQLDALGAAAPLVEETVRLVRLTAAHDPEPGDEAGRLLCDADLAILAAPPERYRRYAAAVRAEYEHVDDSAFRAGRIAVLQGLLAGGIYGTPAARRWEDAAVRNVRGELAALGAAPA